MKTGTTFLQQLMQANTDNLLAAGVLVPGRQGEQVRGTRDILGTSQRNFVVATPEGAWDSLVDKMLAHEGHASVISMEFFSFADVEQAARVVESLHGAEVHIILTVRDATKTLPAQWQTHCRNGGTVAWSKYARAARQGTLGGGDSSSGGGGSFARAQGIPGMLDAWGSAVPPERLHVITVPPSGSDPMLLWKRVAGVVGVDPEVCTVAAPRSNTSLGQPSADLMRCINGRLGGLTKDQYSPTLKAELATNILSQRASLEPSPTLDLDTRRFALAWNQSVREAIEASGAHVVGDLDELPFDLGADVVEQSSGAVIEDSSDQELLEAACTARDGLLDLLRGRAVRVKGAHAEVDISAVDFADRPTKPQRWETAADPLGAAIDELCSLVRVAIDLRDRVVAPRPSKRVDGLAQRLRRWVRRQA